MIFKKFFLNSICFFKIPELYRYMQKKIVNYNPVIIIVYHRISLEKDKWSLASISLDEFEMQIKYMNQNYKIISLEKLVELIKNGKIDDIKDNKIAVITFDDGYKDNYIYAYPILKKYGVPATIFLTAGFIGNDKLFWWDKVGYILYHTKKKVINLSGVGEISLDSDKEIYNYNSILLKYLKTVSNEEKDNLIDELQKICNVKIPKGLGKSLILSWDEVNEMKDSGISFGVHTMTHPVLTKITLEEAKREIIESKKIIENKLGTHVKLFAYPNGGSADFDDRIIKLVREAGFDCAVTTIQGLIYKYDFCNIYKLKRIVLNSGFEKFKIKAAGIYIKSIT